jgi:hypothetical protein
MVITGGRFVYASALRLAAIKVIMSLSVSRSGPPPGPTNGTAFCGSRHHAGAALRYDCHAPGAPRRR